MFLPIIMCSLINTVRSFICDLEKDKRCRWVFCQCNPGLDLSRVFYNSIGHVICRFLASMDANNFDSVKLDNPRY